MRSHCGTSLAACTQHVEHGQVAHDLRTPLNSFSLGLQALSASNLTQEQRDIVSTMEVSAQLMHLTCTKALDHTQLGLGVAMRVNEEMPFSLVRMLEKSEVVVMGYTHESKAVKYVLIAHIAPVLRLIE